jgi:hypothetical protein
MELPEAEIHDAISDPTNHAQTEEAGPPRLKGVPKVAGTEPRTPRTETAYESVDRFVESLLMSYF